MRISSFYELNKVVRGPSSQDSVVVSKIVLPYGMNNDAVLLNLVRNLAGLVQTFRFLGYQCILVLVRDSARRRDEWSEPSVWDVASNVSILVGGELCLKPLT